jgi:hypothetical protein
MQIETNHLDYRAQAPVGRKGRFWFGLGLLIVTIIIFCLRKLETMPYRPPFDMSTFLGGPELALVRALIFLFIGAWCVFLLGFLVSFRTRRR